MIFFRLIWVLCIALIGLTLMVIAERSAESRQQERDITFKRETDLVVNEISNTLTFSTQKVQSLLAFFEASHEISEAELNTFVGAEETFSDGSNIRAVAVMPVLSNNDVPAVLAALAARGDERAELGYKEIGIKTSPDRDIYAPVLYVASPAGPGGILGYDLATSEPRLTTAIAAQSSGQVRVTPPIQLSQDAQGAYPSILVIGATDHGNLGLRDAAAEGGAYPVFVAASYTPGQALQDLFDSIGPIPFGVGIYDVSSAGETLIYQSDLPDSTAASLTQMLSYGGRNWEIRLFDLASGNGIQAEGLVQIFGFILLAVLLVAGDQLIRSRQTLRRTVQEKTQELVNANESLAESEKRRALHIRNTPVGAISWDKDFLVTEWNKAAEGIFGYSEDEAMGKHAADLIVSDELRDEITDVFTQLMAQSGGTRSSNENLTKSGKTIFCEWFNTPITNSAGEAIGVSSLVQDATETLKTREYLESEIEKRTAQLRSAKEEADSANRSKSNFLANMSHEIRTPMNGVLGMTEMLGQSELSSEQKSMLQVIRSSSDALLRIIDDILDISKIEAGKIDLLPEPVALEAIFEGVVNTMRPIARARQVRLFVYYDPSLPKVVSMDSVRVRQVLMNLLSNAIKFSDRKSTDEQGEVHIHFARFDGNRIQIKVIDNGVGMTEGVLSNLFQPFYQGEETTNRIYGGTGLGLVITKSLVSMMGGEIKADSQFGVGSVFTVELPLDETNTTFEEPDLSDLMLFGISATESLKVVLTTYSENACKGVEFASSESELSEMVKNAEGLAIVLLGLSTQKENEAVRAKLAEENDHVRFLNFSLDPLENNQCSLPDCYSVQFYPVLPSEFRHGLSVLAGRASPEIDFKLTETGLQEVANEKQLLVVEDNPINREVITKLVASLGYNCTVAEDGREALNLWQETEFDLILADIQMPVMDGFEMTRKIREQEIANGRRHVPIIAITANALKGEAEKCEEAGMDDFLPKPVRLKDLKLALLKWL